MGAEKAVSPESGLAPQGAIWVFVALAVPRVLGAIVTVALRRALGPGISGTYDLALTPYNLLDTFRNFGTGPALVYRATVSRGVANTAWTLNMIMAVLMLVAAQIAAHPVAVYYGHPAIEGVLRLLSIAYVFSSLGAVHYYLLLRDLDFRARTIAPIGQVVIAGDVAVLAAMWGAGIGALITREILSSVLGAILLWAVYPYRPRLQLLAGPTRQLLRYGVWIGLGLSVLYLSQNVDILVGGHIIRSREDIGFYTTSWSLAFLLASVFTLLAGSMVFPALSRLEGEAFRATLLRALRLMSLLMLPAAALLAAVAPVAIVPVLGGRWVAYRHMYPVLSLLSVYAGIRALLSLFLEGYKAVGKPWMVSAYNLVKLAVLLPVMVFAAHRGIMGLAVAYLPVQIIEIPVALLLARAYLGVTLGSVAAAVRVPLTSTVAMAAAVLGIENAFRHLLHVHELPTLLFCVAVAGPVYLAALRMQDRRILPDTAAVLTRGLVA